MPSAPPRRARSTPCAGCSTRACAPAPTGSRRGSSTRPGCFADTAEIVALCEVVAGTAASIPRTSAASARRSSTRSPRRSPSAAPPASRSRSRTTRPNGAPGRRPRPISSLPRRRGAAGHDVTVDNDVHTDLAPRLSRALPQPVLDLPHDRLIASSPTRPSVPGLRRAVETDELPGAGYTGLVKHGRFDRIVILHAPTQPELRGQTVAAIAAARGARRRSTRSSTSSSRRTTRSSASSITSTRPRSAASSRIRWSWSARTASSCRRSRSWTTPDSTGRAATASISASSSDTCATSRSCASRRRSAR